MKNKKGFTFVEVLVVVLLIAIISIVAVPSYKRSLETSKNNQAKAKLIEVANAARMYNEDAPSGGKVAGYMHDSGSSVTGYQTPQNLFRGAYHMQDGDNNYAYLKDPESFDSNGRYRGYDFYVCNPDSADAVCGGNANMIAIMIADNVTDERFAGKRWGVSVLNTGKAELLSSGS